MGELSGFMPYDESLEPIATQQEVVQYNESVTNFHSRLVVTEVI